MMCSNLIQPAFVHLILAPHVREKPGKNVLSPHFLIGMTAVALPKPPGLPGCQPRLPRVLELPDNRLQATSRYQQLLSLHLRATEGATAWYLWQAATEQIPHRDVFPATEYGILQTSISDMVTALDLACHESMDPPDAAPLVVAQRVRTGRRGRPRVEIDSQFLSAALDLRGPTGIAPEIGRHVRSQS
ncbi:hypothetical protein B0H10DRAFT_1964257 [Mycena sp. CBHHK59/15]|nr:hypothetical protein B0H10DRAFT_1964257 [Mycena sp. CBHHK59/15]